MVPEVIGRYDQPKKELPLAYRPTCFHSQYVWHKTQVKILAQQHLLEMAKFSVRMITWAYMINIKDANTIR